MGKQKGDAKGSSYFLRCCSSPGTVIIWPQLLNVDNAVHRIACVVSSRFLPSP